MNKLNYRFLMMGATKYFVLLLFNYYSYYFLDKLGIIKIFDKDIIPCFDICSIIFVFLVGIGVLIYFFSKTETILNIFVKRYERSIKTSMFFIGILIWQRCYGDVNLCLVYILMMYVYYMMIEYESTKIFDYNISKDDSAPDCYEERPVIGRDLLTKPQVDVLDKLLTVLNTRDSNQSVNIGLIGKWGKGKSSIIDTLIYELQNKKSTNSEYFILKLDMGMLKETVNVVEYVNNYFYILFRRYGIISLGSFGGLTYFSSFQKLLEKTDFSVISKLSFTENENYFSDLEFERDLFSAKVKKLLGVSRKKNVVLIIDEADRVGVKEQVAQLLSEFSGIKGIISIMLLNESMRGPIRPGSPMYRTQLVNDDNENTDFNEDHINKFSKYIHLEIFIENLEKIEYEKSIKEQIVLANEKLITDGIYYVNYVMSPKARSIFDNVLDYGTTRPILDVHTVYTECNLLTELFNVELGASSDSFGVFLERKVKEFFLSCKEFENIGKYKHNAYMQLRMPSFFGSLFGMDDYFDWAGHIGGTFNQLFGDFVMLMHSIKMIEECSKEERPQISNLDDIKLYYMKERFGSVGFNENSYSPARDGNYATFKSLFFSREEEGIIINLLNNNNFKGLYSRLEHGAEKALNISLLGISIIQFMEYLRRTMNNYRLFKMQIREAELLNVSYLDYLTKDWHVKNATVEEFNAMRENNPWMEHIHINWPHIRTFFNTIMYQKFVQKNGRILEQMGLYDIKALTLNSTERKVLVLTGKDNKNNMFYRAVSIVENEKCSLSKEEKELLKIKTRELYYEFRNADVMLELNEV